MSTATTAGPPDLWLDGTAAGRLLGTGSRAVARLADRGLITYRAVPGVRGRYLFSDVARLAAESVRPAGREEQPRA